MIDDAGGEKSKLVIVDQGVVLDVSALLYRGFSEPSRVSGYVADTGDWSRRFVVELLLDGWPVDLARCDRYDARMPMRGQPSPTYGFTFDLQRFDTVRWSSLAVGLANNGLTLAHFDAGTRRIRRPTTPGSVRWHGGLTFEGWLDRGPGEKLWIRAVIEENVVATLQVDLWRMVDTGASREARPGFTLDLPPGFADGRVHQIAFVDGDGRELEGSPLSFLAFADGLAAFLDQSARAPGERIRGTVFDRMFPQSVPFDAFDAWSARFRATSERPLPTSIAMVVVGEAGSDATMSSLPSSGADSIVGVLPSVAGCGDFEAADLIHVLEEAGHHCATVIMAIGGTRFEQGGLEDLARMLDKHSGAACAYGDLLIQSGEGETAHRLPLAFPDFDYERCLEQGYPAWCFAIRRDRALEAARAGVNSLCDLFFHSIDPALSAEKAPAHLQRFVATLPMLRSATAETVLKPAVLAHLLDRGIRAAAEPSRGVRLPSVFVKRAITAETISVVIATHNRADEVQTCIDHLRGLRTRHRLDLLVADMGSSEPALLRFFASPTMRDAIIVRVAGAINPARALNRGAERAVSRFLLFLDSTVTLDDPDPIENLVSRCSDPTTAAAAATLVWAGGTIQSSGLVLSHAFGASSAGAGLGDADPGYGEMMTVAQERSALSASCLLVKRQDHTAIEGFDDTSFGCFFFAVDYSLRLRARGRRLVVTPHARATRWRQDALEEREHEPAWRAATRRRELATLRLRWGERLHNDPCYNPQLALNGDLHSALAWPPRDQLGAARVSGPVEQMSGDRDTPSKKTAKPLVRRLGAAERSPT